MHISAEYDEEAPAHLANGEYYRGGYQPVAQDHHKPSMIHPRQTVPHPLMPMGGGSLYRPLHQPSNYPYHQQQPPAQRRPIPVNRHYWEQEDSNVGYSVEDERMVSEVINIYPLSD